MQKKNLLIFGGTKGIGALIKKKFSKNKNYQIYSISRSIKKRRAEDNVVELKCNILEKNSVKKLKEYILKKDLTFDTIVYSIGDHFDFKETAINSKYLDLLLNINLKFPIQFNNFLIKNKNFNKSKFIFMLTDALKHLNAKSSYIISKGACRYYINAQAYYFKKINCSITGVMIGPYLYSGSVWHNIKKNDIARFEKKKKTIKNNIFPKPNKYIKVIEKIIKSPKGYNGKIFNPI